MNAKLTISRLAFIFHVSTVSANCVLLPTVLSEALPDRVRAPGLLRDRSTLLGTPPISGRSSPFDGILVNGHRYADDLEGQNDEALEGLSSKVKQLKDVSELERRSSVVFGLACFIRCHLAHNWYWKRGPGVNDTANPDGTSLSATHSIVLT